MKKVFPLLAIIVLVLVAFTVRETYAYYVDSNKRSGSFDVAAWKVIVNDSDISEVASHEFTIADMVWNPVYDSLGNPITNGKLAPGMSGIFVIKIDPSLAQTAIDYTINFDQTEFTNPNIKITSVDANGEKLFADVNGLYKGVISLDQIKNKDIITLTTLIEWINEEANNDNDAETGSKSNTKLNVPVTIEFNQKTD